MSERMQGDYGAGPRRRGGATHPRRRPTMSPTLAIATTVVGTILPGTGLIIAGLRRIGALVLTIFAIMVVIAAYLGATQQRAILHWAVQPEALLVIGVVFPLIGLAWVAVIVGTYRAVQPRQASTGQRLLGSAFVMVLALVVLLPLAVGGRYAQVQKGFVEQVFAAPDSKSATRPKNVSRKDPWAGQDRVNVLLLGGDGGKDRIGIRPDSQIVASIDTHTGNTVLFSLPRNLEKVPFPPDSALAKAYPNGVYAGGGDQLEWMLNSIYENVPRQHPGLLDSDNPGADANKLGVGAALGLRIDYYVLLNLNGFEKLVDALGGITVNVNTKVAIGGAVDEGIKPRDWIQPGPDKHLDGYHALWFARGRYGADDYQRMERQRCTMRAIIDQADPGKLLTRYEAIAQSSKNFVFTDIPGALLPAFVDLSMKVKGANVTSIAFTNKIIHPWDPDYDLMRSMVQKALADSTSAAAGKGDKPKANPDGKRTATPKPEAGTPSPKPSDGAQELTDACAYSPPGSAG